jgi:pimeloyl-ACP methyl ester carboxylesterase
MSATSTTTGIDAWRARGRTVAARDGDVWMLDVPGGDGAATPVLALHGFPSSAHDFSGVLDAVTAKRRLVTFDFVGYGLSSKPRDHGYSLFEQADVALEVARAAGIERAHLWAHDMGTSVATELLARRERGLLPLRVASLTLMNGSLHVEMAHLTLGQRLLRTPLGDAFARLNNRATFVRQLRRTFARPPSEETLEAMWQLASRDGGLRLASKTIRYVTERQRHARRWIGALERLDVPALVAWGRRDPVAVIAIAERLAREIPHARFVTWDDLAHWPQVEDPPRVAATVTRFWDDVEK